MRPKRLYKKRLFQLTIMTLNSLDFAMLHYIALRGTSQLCRNPLVVIQVYAFCRNVNKKALDQYMNFTEQREELVRRHDETVRGKQKIQQLIQTLDLRKDEAIERTFKVTSASSSIFQNKGFCVVFPILQVFFNARYCRKVVSYWGRKVWLHSDNLHRPPEFFPNHAGMSSCMRCVSRLQVCKCSSLLATVFIKTRCSLRHKSTLSEVIQGRDDDNLMVYRTFVISKQDLRARTLVYLEGLKA